MTDDERMQREANLIATIRAKLPDFARMCADDSELVMLHQDAFAADYQEDEYLLLGIGAQVRRTPWEGSAGNRKESEQSGRRRENPVETMAPVTDTPIIIPAMLSDTATDPAPASAAHCAVRPPKGRPL